MATNKKNGGKAGVGAGIAAAAAAAAIGAYFLYGKNGPQNRKKVKGWMLRAKGEILEQMEKLEEVSEERYRDIVDRVAARYAGLREVDKADLVAMVADARRHWTSMKKLMGKKGKRSAASSGKSSKGKKKA